MGGHRNTMIWAAFARHYINNKVEDNKILKLGFYGV